MTLDAPQTPVTIAADADAPVVLRMRGITRRFGPRPGNQEIDLELRRGEIVGLVGDNGAGKTTLTDVLFGDDIAEAGDVQVADAGGELKNLKPGSPRATLRAGIGRIHRQPALGHNLTALENIIVGTQSYWRPRLWRSVARARVRDLMRRLDFAFDLDVRVGKLPSGDRLRVELLRALDRGARILVFDEPSAVLTGQETASLFGTLKSLAQEGLAIIVTSRKLDDAFEVATRIVVLRGGRKVSDAPAAGQDRAILAALMTGRVVTKGSPGFHSAGESLLDLRKVDVRGGDVRTSLHQVSLDVRAGEIMGIGGLPGNGQQMLAAVAAGLVRPRSGRVFLFGKEITRFNPAAFIQAGVGRIPADRYLSGIVPDLSVAENLVLEDVRRLRLHQYGILLDDKIRERAGAIVARNVAPAHLDVRARLLAGRDIQNLIFARTLERKPRLLIADQPTRGLDAAAAAAVHRRLTEQRDAGVGVLLISDDVDELLNLADAIAVLHEGRLTQPQPTGALDEMSIGHMMGGRGSMALDWAGWGEGT